MGRWGLIRVAAGRRRGRTPGVGCGELGVTAAEEEVRVSGDPVAACVL